MVSRCSLTFLFLTVLILVGPGCVARDKYISARNTIQTQDAVINNYKGTLTALQGQVTQLRDEMQQMKAQRDRALSSETALQDAHLTLTQKYKELRESFGRDLPAGVALETRSEGMAFQVEGRVLFDSGRAEIKEDGKNALLDIIARIQNTSEKIRVEGHTDNDPVTKVRNLYPKGNLELSGERALNVAAFLVENGVDSSRVSYSGLGQHKPRASNDTPEGKSQNRRVEIVVLFQKPQD